MAPHRTLEQAHFDQGFHPACDQHHRLNQGGIAFHARENACIGPKLQDGLTTAVTLHGQ